MKTIYLSAAMAPALPLSALPQGNHKHFYTFRWSVFRPDERAQTFFPQ